MSKSFRERRAWLVGLLSLLLIGGGLAGAFSINKFESLRGVYPLSADLEDAAGLIPGNEVRVAGVKVGTVKDVVLTPASARVRMEIQREVDVPLDSILEVKLKTILGQKFIDLQIAGDAGASGNFDAGDVIPMDQTRIPFEMHQAATEGTATLEQLDKAALREMLTVLADVTSTSSGELRRAIVAIEEAGEVLGPKSVGISRVLANLEAVTGTLAASDESIAGSLSKGADVLGEIAAKRRTISSLLVATEDFTKTLALLIQTARSDVATGVGDLNSLLLAAEGELDSIALALAELGVAQEMFARPLKFGRFTEGQACAVLSADTCNPKGIPTAPGLPTHGVQPESVARRVLR